MILHSISFLYACTSKRKAAAFILLNELSDDNEKKKRSFQVNDIFQKRHGQGHHQNLVKELAMKYSEDFHRLLRIDTFWIL